MGRIDTIRGQLSRLQDEAAKLQHQMASHDTAAGKAAAAAHGKRDEANRTKSASMAHGYVKSALTLDKKAANEGSKSAAIATKLAKNAKDQRTVLKNIDTETARETRARVAADRSRRREDQRQVVRLENMVEQVQAAVAQPAPMLTVLYVTANPEAVERVYQTAAGETITEGEWLRVDAEVRDVERAIRGALHKNLIEVKHLPAATFEDLIAGLNNHQPDVLHFSGHGSGEMLLFEQQDGLDGGVEVAFEHLAALLGTLRRPPRLLVLNACDSLHGADALLQAVPVVIAMAGRLQDLSAKLFARTFYNAIANGETLGTGMAQARQVLTVALAADAEMPTWRVLSQINVDEIVLVDLVEGSR